MDSFSSDSLRNGVGIPSEITGDLRVLADNPTKARETVLKRGQYRIEYRAAIPVREGPVEELKEQFMTYLKSEDGEKKRIWIYKLDSTPTDKVVKQNGEKVRVHKVVLVFRVLDNPVWVVPAIKAVTWIGTGITSYFVIDKVGETAEESIAGSFITVAAATFSIWYILGQILK